MRRLACTAEKQGLAPEAMGFNCASDATGSAYPRFPHVSAPDADSVPREQVPFTRLRMGQTARWLTRRSNRLIILR